MTYTVIRPFKDMRDKEQHEYKIDDVFRFLSLMK